MLCVWTLPYGCRFEPERQQIPRVEMQEDLGALTCLVLYVAVIIGFYNAWIPPHGIWNRGRKPIQMCTSIMWMMLCVLYVYVIKQIHKHKAMWVESNARSCQWSRCFMSEWAVGTNSILSQSRILYHWELCNMKQLVRPVHQGKSNPRMLPLGQALGRHAWRRHM